MAQNNETIDIDAVESDSETDDSSDIIPFTGYPTEQIDRLYESLQDIAVQEGIALGNQISSIPAEVILRALQNVSGLPNESHHAIEEKTIRLYSLQLSDKLNNDNRQNRYLIYAGVALVTIVTFCSFVFTGGSSVQSSGGHSTENICQAKDFLSCGAWHEE